MKKHLIILIVIFSFSFAPAQTKQSSTGQGIREVFCQIKNGDYPGAQNNLEKILQKEPQNLFARRLWPGVLAHQIKKDDKSPENIARIRKTVEAYRQFQKTTAISPEEKADIDDLIISLFERISEQEKTGELLKMVEDKNQTPEARSNFYTKLAAQSYSCANEIVSAQKKPAKPEIEKAKNCVSKGLEYANQAVMLHDANEGAWSYQASLLILSAKIAGFENNPAQKEKLQKEYEAAKNRYLEVSRKRSELLRIKDEERNKQPERDNRAAEIKQFSEELINYKAELPLEKFITEIYIPLDFSGLVAPVDLDPESENKKTDQELPKNTDNEKREWKAFSPKDEELAGELPDNVSADIFGEMPFYRASSEGVSYQILSQPRAALQTSDQDDAVLNTLAWSWALPMANFWLMGAPQNSYEVNFLRKANFAGQPGRIYALTLGSCSGKMDGALIVLVGKKRNYIIDIRGAGEQDLRVQRFLKSLKFTARN